MGVAIPNFELVNDSDLLRPIYDSSKRANNRTAKGRQVSRHLILNNLSVYVTWGFAAVGSHGVGWPASIKKGGQVRARFSESDVEKEKNTKQRYFKLTAP